MLFVCGYRSEHLFNALGKHKEMLKLHKYLNGFREWRIKKIWAIEPDYYINIDNIKQFYNDH